MKHFFRNYFWVLSAAMVLLAGCSTEQEIVDSDNGDTTKGKITFSFPISKGTSTYATVTAVGNESLFSAADMTIYMVNASDSIESIFSGTSITGSGSSITQVATIELPSEATSDKRFYFVANTSSVSTALSSIVVGSSLTNLLEVVTNVQSAHLSSASGLLLTGSVTVPLASLAATTPTPISVTLKRRVARFDISNDATTSMVTIKRVLISDAKTTALAFADKDSLPLTKGNLPSIDFMAIAGANAGISQSVFYLYPSDSVAIQLLAEVGGIEQLFKLPLPTGGIKANKCYTIRARYSAQTPSFNLTAEDWTQGEEIEAVSEGSVDIAAASVTGHSAGWNAETSQYDVNAITTTTPTTIELTASASSPSGVIVQLEGAPSGYELTAATTGTPTLTYAAGYRQTVTITIPQYTGAAPLDARVIIKDALKPTQSKTISITRKDYYPTAHKGWAGCNIYYDEDKGHLTFDDIGITEHEKYQGVYFQWGSLWGISPMGAIDDIFDTTDTPTGTIMYPPAGGKTSAYAAGLTWTTIPHIPNGTFNPEIEDMRRDWAYTYQVTDSITGRGDICRWLTYKGYAPAGKSWRMPTSREFGESKTVHSFGAWINGANEVAVADGTNVINSGRSLKNVTPNVFFPASASRGSASGNITSLIRASANYWTASHSSIYGHNIWFNNGSVNPNNIAGRASSFSVRCVVE